MTTTIITTPQEDQRISVAWGIKLNLGRNANAAEVKADVISYMKNVCMTIENDSARSTALSNVVLPDPINPT